MTQGTLSAIRKVTFKHYDVHTVWFALLPTLGMLFYMEWTHVARVREFGE